MALRWFPTDGMTKPPRPCFVLGAGGSNYLVSASGLSCQVGSVGLYWLHENAFRPCAHHRHGALLCSGSVRCGRCLVRDRAGAAAGLRGSALQRGHYLGGDRALKRF